MSGNRDPIYAPDGKTWYQLAMDEAAKRSELADRIEQLEAALRTAYDFLQDKSFTPNSLTHECTKVLNVMEAALAPEQEK